MSDDAPKRIDHFNTMVGLIFAQLYDNFPLPIYLDEAAIADAMDVPKQEVDVGMLRKQYNFGQLSSGDNFYPVLSGARIWLRDEGFIRARGELASIDLVLTSKALTVMNATPIGLSSSESLGSQLSSAAKGADKSAGNAAIGDLVGQVIGGVTKGLFG